MCEQRDPACDNHERTCTSGLDEAAWEQFGSVCGERDGAEYRLNSSAWDAAYDYYGHDATGVSYAD